MSRFVPDERPLMLSYLGTSGALPKLTLDLARVAVSQREIPCAFMVSSFNELIEPLRFLQPDLFAVRTFQNKWRSITDWSTPIRLRARLKERFSRDKTQVYVSLMPHVWSPLIAPVIRRAGVRHAVLVHDADPHPGDPYGLVNRWLLREAAKADHVITLSKFVARRLTVARGIPEGKISVLFHPDLSYGAANQLPVNEHGALRILFMGRLLPYKGLGLLLDAVELLRKKEVPLELGVFGQGKIEPSFRQRLTRLGAEVDNRWLRHDEFGQIFSRYDVLVAAHTEASQSGVVAAALGAGLPVITTPVGGLVEQVVSGVTGIVAKSATALAFADAIRELAEDRRLLMRLRQGIAATREERSMERFFGEVCRIALDRSF